MTFSRTFSKSTMSLMRDLAAAGRPAPQARPKARAADRQSLESVFMNDLAPDRRTNGSPTTAHASFVPTAGNNYRSHFSELTRWPDAPAAAGQELPSINHPASTKHRHWA